MELHTQYTYEKKWLKTSEKESLRMILEEMPDTDASATLSYIVAETNKGKTITLGECRFKNILAINPNKQLQVNVALST